MSDEVPPTGKDMFGMNLYLFDFKTVLMNSPAFSDSLRRVRFYPSWGKLSTAIENN